mmetsp:Transcript_45551/g.120341  ORF Transcript_45551/g.120341 Transcript_45551/m.120341 type:complete len:231 (-) Transcript_45551:706-1398(-)
MLPRFGVGASRARFASGGSGRGRLDTSSGGNPISAAGGLGGGEGHFAELADAHSVVAPFETGYLPISPSAIVAQRYVRHADTPAVIVYPIGDPLCWVGATLTTWMHLSGVDGPHSCLRRTTTAGPRTLQLGNASKRYISPPAQTSNTSARSLSPNQGSVARPTTPSATRCSKTPTPQSLSLQSSPMSASAPLPQASPAGAGTNNTAPDERAHTASPRLTATHRHLGREAT